MFTALRRKLHLRQLRQRIAKHGWTAIYVGDYSSVPSWAYTLGFDETLNQPEIVVFDIPRQSAGALLRDVFDSLKSGRLVLEDGTPWVLDGEPCGVWRKVHPSQIDTPDLWLAAALNRREQRTGRRHGLEAFQLVAADVNGRFPWEADYDELVRPRQPALWLASDAASSDAGIPDFERTARRLVRERGWTTVGIDLPEIKWAYTIGLNETFGLPDLIAFGPRPSGMERMLMDALAALRQGRLVLSDGVKWDELGFETCFRPVHESQYLGFNWCYLAKEIREERTGRRDLVPMFQLFLGDASDRYPWDPSCERTVRDLQPELFRPLDLSRLPRSVLAGARAM